MKEPNDDQMPACMCGWCGDVTDMRVDANFHPIDKCPTCGTEGFMGMLGAPNTESNEENP